MPPFRKFFRRELPAHEVTQGNLGWVSKMGILIHEIHSSGSYSIENKQAAESLRNFLRTVQDAKSLSSDQIIRLEGLLRKMGVDETEIGQYLSNR
jgi:hypothetical protein